MSLFGRHCLRLVSGVGRQATYQRVNRTASLALAGRCTPHKTPALQPVSVATFHSTAHRYTEHIINIQDEEDFGKRVLNNQTPIIIDFHAEWCGPCKILGPRLESLIAKKEGKVVLAKVDIDNNADLAMEHGVQAVPTVLAMKGGRVVDRFVGVQDDSQLESFINGLTGD